MVQLEANVAAIKAQTDAIRELFEEGQRSRRKADERLEEHEKSDNQKFASIDSRLQGFQTQMSTVVDSLARIEGKIKPLENELLSRSAVGRFLQNAWVQVGIGAGLAGAMVAVYNALS